MYMCVYVFMCMYVCICMYTVPYNRLHDKGYTSIGDTHSTVMVVADEQGERAGRFKVSVWV